MSTVTPEPILKLLGAVQAIKHLYTANACGLFEKLADGPQSLTQLARGLEMPERTARILIDALVAASFVERDIQGYRNAPVAQQFLAGRSPVDLRPLVALWHHLVDPQMHQLETALREDRATLHMNDFNDRERTIFQRGVSALTAPTARALAAVYSFGDHQRVLDVCGGVGTFLRSVLAVNGALEASLIELPETARLARTHLASLGLAERVCVVEGDVFTDELPRDHDVIIVANVLHMFAPERIVTLLSRLREVVAEGGRILLVDFWTDASRANPPMAAYMAAAFHVFTGAGDVYGTEQARGWLAESGWEMIDHRPLTGATSVIVGQAVATG